MRAGISAILLSVCSPVAIIVGAPFAALYWYLTRDLRKEVDPPIICSDGWSGSPPNDTRIFHPQRKR